MARLTPVLALVAVAACADPHSDRAALLSLDRDAREAGIQLEVSGERLAPELPVAVDPSEEAWVVRPDARERLVPTPGEWIELRGAEGRATHAAIDPDRFVATGDASSAAALAELLGASVDPIGGDRWAFHAPGVVWVAALFARDRGVASGLGTSPLDTSPLVAGLAAGDTAWRARGPSEPPPAVDRDVLGEVPDAASLVGVYRHADVVLVVDASGGYSLVVASRRTHGTFLPMPGGVRFTGDDGDVTELDLRGDVLTDGETLALSAATTTGGSR